MGSQYRVEMLGCANDPVDPNGLIGALAGHGFSGPRTAEEASLGAVKTCAAVAG